MLARNAHVASLNRARNRLRRLRRKLGIECTTIEYDHEDLEVLIALKYLNRDECGDRRKVAAAIRVMLKAVRLPSTRAPT